MSKIVKSVGAALGFGGESAVKHAGAAQTAGVQDQIRYLQGAEQRATERLSPFVSLGADNISRYQELLNPGTRYSAVMSNPLVSGALQEIGRQVGTSGAAAGRFNSGDTVNALFNKNFGLLNSLGQQELSNYLTPVQLGQSAAAGSAANTLSSGAQIGSAYGNIGDINAATILGRQNASAQLGNSLFQMGGGAMQGAGLLGGGGIAGGGGMGALLGAFLSDERTKEDIKLLGKDDEGNNVYEYSYKHDEKPKYIGYMAQEVAQKDPGHVTVLPNRLLAVSGKYKPVRVS